MALRGGAFTGVTAVIAGRFIIETGIPLLGFQNCACPLSSCSLEATCKLKALRYPGKTRIVILDDEEGVRDTLKSVLELLYEQIEFAEFSDGDEASRELKRQVPDLFVTDWAHPGKPCGELFAQLTEGTKCPVLFTSARDKESCRMCAASAIEKGLKVEILPKPWEAEDLRDLIVSILGTPTSNRFE